MVDYFCFVFDVICICVHVLINTSDLSFFYPYIVTLYLCCIALSLLFSFHMYTRFVKDYAVGKRQYAVTGTCNIEKNDLKNVVFYFVSYGPLLHLHALFNCLYN